MGTITLALRTAQSGLLANQQALDVTARNISNVNTEGYSRKVVGFENSALVGAGSGVNISQISRQIDEGLLKSTRLEKSELTELTSQSTFWDRLQDLFGTPEANTSISHTITEFGKAIESLVVTPNNALEATETVRRAEDLTEQLQQMSIAIQDLRLQADQQLSDVATELNTLVNEIDTLNDDIISAGSVNRETSDLRDQRDLKVTRVAELIDIRYFARSDGDLVVFTANGRTLVDTVPPAISHTPAAAVTPTSTHAEGDFGGFFIGSTENPANDATSDIRNGQAKGLIDMRDTVLPNLQSQLDELSAQLRDVMNKAHNRGVSFPGAQEYNGTRTFVEPTTQLFKLDPTNSTDDVAITLFDAAGDQSVTTTLNTIMTGAGLSTRGSTNDWTVTSVATNLQSWLRNNGATSATATITDGNFDIALNTTTLNLAFRDETATTVGSTASDAEIGYDSNADGVIDETVQGFSNFFGLNDLFVDNQSDNIWESNVLSNGTTTPSTAQTLTFRSATGSLGTLTIPAGSSLSDIVTQVSNDTTLSQKITAAVVPDGSGSRLRFSHNDGSSFQITQAATDTFLSETGINIADVRVSGSLQVRSDILTAPQKISTGQAQWDSTRGVAGEYLMGTADETVAQSMAITLNGSSTFSVAGGLPVVNTSFGERAAAIVATNASLASTHERNTDAQRSLSEALNHQFESERGVNLDEEMANLIVFEQAFSAAARIITTIQRMFDALERVL